MQEVNQLLDEWVTFWNTYDLDRVSDLFLDSEDVTYFSSEKVGLMRGLDAILEHHAGFGFVVGGKESANRLWLEDTATTQFDSAVVVSSIWYFERATGELMRGPVTFVCLKVDDGYRFAHMNFSNYK